VGVGEPDIRGDAQAVEGAPTEAAAEEGGEEDDAVEELDRGAREVQFVAEPVDIEEGGGELVEDEGWSVVVYEGSLSRTNTYISISHDPQLDKGGRYNGGGGKDVQIPN